MLIIQPWDIVLEMSSLLVINNTIIGYQADPSAIDASNQIVIGKDATGVGDNYAVIGNASVTRVYAAQDAGATLYAGGLNIGGTAVTSTAAELNILDGVTATATELNLIDGVTATTAEINYLDGVTSNIQTQLNSAGGASNVTGLSDALVEDNSVYIGNDPSSTTNSAQYNVAVGTTALDAITTGDKIVAIGYNALGANTTGSSNTALGMYALNSNTTGNLNTAVGNESLKSNTTGSNNTALGWESLSANTTGSYNTGSGLYVLRNNTTGEYNTAMGYEAGDVITTGSNNVIFGYGADPSSNNASNQIVIGKGATGQGDNYAVIGNADVTRVYAAQDGEANIYAKGLYRVTDAVAEDLTISLTGSNDASINIVSQGTGTDAIILNATAGGVDVDAAAAKDVNIAGGQVALESKDNAASAISLTTNQGTSETIVITNTQGTSSSAVDINATAGGVDIDASGAITIDGGSVSIEGLTYPGSDGTNGQVLTTNGSGTLSWSNASSTNITGLSDALIESNSLYLGNDPSGTTTNTAQKNIAVGATALDAITSGSSNTAVGYDALSALTTGASNTAIGENSLSSLTDGTANVALGRSTMYSNTSGDYNVAVGHGAAGQLTTGGHNTAIGYNALRSVTTNSSNIAVGSNTAYNATGSQNTAVGVGAATNLTSGNYNTFLGYDAGDITTTGSRNTYLGYDTEGSANSVSNETAIGANAIGQGSNTVTVGDDNVTAVYLSEDKGATVYAGALDVTASGGITLENDETITNSTDGTVAIGGNLTGTGSISGFDANLNDQTGTTYTLTSSDNGKVITLNNANAITLTIAASLGDGFNCLIVQKGAGQVTLSAAGGVTVVNRSSETKTAGQYATVSVINIGSEQYILSGDTGS